MYVFKTFSSGNIISGATVKQIYLFMAKPLIASNGWVLIHEKELKKLISAHRVDCFESIFPQQLVVFAFWNAWNYIICLNIL